MSAKKRTPGPGAYRLNATEMNGSGSYILSNYHNYSSPRYQSQNNRSRSPNNTSVGPGQCTTLSNIDNTV
jgi:hypothetical protein